MGSAWRLLKRLLQRCAFFLSQNYWWTVLVAGVILEAAALARWEKWQPWSSILAGVGGSVLATVLVSLFGPGGDRIYQTFLRLGVTEFWANRDLYPKTRWVGGLREANHQCTLLGQAHGDWCADDGFRDALVDRLKAGVMVEVFFLDPTGGAAQVRHNEDRRGLKPLLSRTRASIKELWDIRQQLDPPERDRLRLYVYNATPSLGLTWIDDTMLVTHYLAGSLNLTSPLLRVESRPARDTLYSVYARNVDAIRNNYSTEISADNIARLTMEGN